MKEPYSGTVQLISSEIAEDLAYYLTDSDQVPSAVGSGGQPGPGWTGVSQRRFPDPVPAPFGRNSR